MPRKEINEILVELAAINGKLDGIADLLKRHDYHLSGHDGRLRHVEKNMNVAFGWAGAIGFVASAVATWVWDKLGVK
jgi:hypothetical protein